MARCKFLLFLLALGTGIDFACFGGDNVHSNAILGAGTGIGAVPSGVVSPDTDYNVGTIRTTGTIIDGYCE